mgnify:CR=1 FL=1
MASVYKLRIGRQGRIVLPKELREVYGVDAGDEAVILVRGRELNLRLRKVSKDPLQDLIKLSEGISIGLSAEELKKKADEERLKDFLKA